MKLESIYKIRIFGLGISLTIWLIIFSSSSCKKIVDIKPPVASITTGQVFADSADANSAIQGIYETITAGGAYQIANGFATIFPGMSADELLAFNSQGNNFQTNTLLSTDNTVGGCWNQAYAILYQSNASIEGLSASKSMSQSAKNQFIGEAKFIRALYYFYLVNLFGDVPLITTSDYNLNAIASRTPSSSVYESIINDLLAAQSLLRKDYSYTNGQRIRANSFAATALLARVYLYLGKWQDAETLAGEIVNNSSNFNLASDLNQVFSVNSTEAILQWNLNPAVSNVTYEGLNFVPYDNMSPTQFYLRPGLLSSFEHSDKRRKFWVDSTNYNNSTYYYPYKYKNGSAQVSPTAQPTELCTVLRLAEQYLIRAEARAQLMDLSGAIADINVIRNRAGLQSLSASTMNQSQVLAAVYQERRIELFAECGQRWLDLKRTGMVDAVIGKLKPATWKSFQQLYPIPYSEIVKDHNLKQNPGY